jgi:hypothetical protein
MFLRSSLDPHGACPRRDAVDRVRRHPSAWLSEANRTTAFFAFCSLSNIRLAQIAEDYFALRIDFNPFLTLGHLASKSSST